MSQTVFDHASIDFERAGKQAYEVAFPHDGTWGNVLVPMTVINGERGPGKSVLLVGGTHGNEYEGQVGVWRLARDLQAADLAGRVILIPRLNAPACDAGLRPSPLDGVNMNRAFPGDSRGSITYRIAEFVNRRVFPQVEVVIDLHSGGSQMRFAPCASYHRMSDPKQERETYEVACLFDTPFVMIYSSEMHHGLLTDRAEELGKVTVGSELGWGNACIRQGLRHAYEGSLNVLRHYGLLEGAIARIDAQRESRPRAIEAANLSDYVPAPISGIFEPVIDPGEYVSEGQVVGRLWDFERVESDAVDLRAPREGWLLLQPFAAQVSKGDTCIVVAQEVTY